MGGIIFRSVIGTPTKAYSGFQGTDLAALLASRGVRRAFVCGLATEYCVKATALDGWQVGLDVVVIDDAIRGVEVRLGDCAGAIVTMRATGIGFAREADLAG